MNVSIVAFWMPHVMVLMTLMTWLLALNLLFNKDTLLGESVSTLLQSCKPTNIITTVTLVIFCHVDVIKSKEKWCQFKKQVYYIIPYDMEQRNNFNSGVN